MMTVSSTSADRTLRLAAIVLILLAGIMTGAQLGKIAPLIPWYEDEIGLSLVATGWLAALLGIFIAVAAMPSGWLIDRLGLSTSILAGATAVTLGGIALALSTAPAAIFAARLVEAVGYLALCVALPSSLSAISPPSWKGPVLAIWSGFVPLGFATSDFLASAMLPAFEPTVFLLAMTGLFASIAAAALLLLARFDLRVTAGSAGGIRPTLTPNILLLALSFGAFVVLSVSMFTFMPVFLAQDGAHYLLSAGVIAASVPAGNFLASALVRGKNATFMSRLAIAGFLVSVLTAVPAFTLADPILATASALALAVSGAVVASAQFAAIPFLTPKAGSVSVAFGLVAQAGGLGTLFGPPFAALVVQNFGWAGFGWFLATVALAGLASMVPVARSTSGNHSLAAEDGRP